MKKIFVAGHRGMVGSAICRQLQKQVDVEIITRTRDELDLCDQSASHAFMHSEKPDEVILAAAKVGGIHANDTYPADFIYQNLQIQNNVIHAAHVNDVQKLLFLGSSCIYPRAVEQPMKEDALLSGILEPTNEPYAIAKIAGIKMCESYNRQYDRDYRSVMPTNLYGIGDNYHPENSHVVPSLIRRFNHAKLNREGSVVVWGTGKPMRELMYVDDFASICTKLSAMEKKDFFQGELSTNTHINVGSNIEVSIQQLAELIKDVVGFKGDLLFDDTRPDGTMRKSLNCEKLQRLLSVSATSLKEGLILTYRDYVQNLSRRS
jgi:GDP-L-fucose synthase